MRQYPVHGNSLKLQKIRSFADCPAWQAAACTAADFGTSSDLTGKKHFLQRKKVHFPVPAAWQRGKVHFFA